MDKARPGRGLCTAGGGLSPPARRGRGGAPGARPSAAARGETPAAQAEEELTAVIVAMVERARRAR